jgi:hypothetical protein
MTSERSTVNANRLIRRDRPGRGEQGQMLVMFVVAIFVVVGVVGLVLDGGSAFAQRRSEQNVADLSSMAGAYAYLSATGTVAARSAIADAAARQIATANGYTHGVGGTSVAVSFPNANANGTDVKVDLTGAHRNNFAAILGMSTWNVSVTATANSTTRPNGANGAMPLLFNAAAFPGAVCDDSAGPCVPEVYQLPGTGNQDVPQDATQFNWTVFCTANGANGTNNGAAGQHGCNANSRDVADLMDNNGTSTTIYLTDDIGPFDAGTHSTLFDNLEAHDGETFPVPIVDNSGMLTGWAYFHLVDVEGAPDKVIRGYFVSPVNAEKLVVTQGGGTSLLDTGVMPIKLTN